MSGSVPAPSPNAVDALHVQLKKSIRRGVKDALVCWRRGVGCDVGDETLTHTTLTMIDINITDYN